MEVRSVEGNKGYFVQWYLNQLDDASAYLPIAIGDDQTDEDMFKVLQEEGVSLKIGEEQTIADYQMPHQEQVFETLELIAKEVK